MKDKRGFTLIELLATMVILGIIMAVAIPNIMGIFNNSKNKTYVSDAKRLVSLAEYKFRSDSSIIRPVSGSKIIFTLEYLDNSEFNNAPNGEAYDPENSMVIIRNTGEGYNSYEYSVILVDTDGKGINSSREDLYNKKPKELVTEITASMLSAAREGVAHTNNDGEATEEELEEQYPYTPGS